MPKEHKHSRGRREEKKEKKSKRKRDEGDEDLSQETKRRKSHLDEPTNEIEFTGTDNVEAHVEDDEGGKTERPFYGMLEDEEQEYFRHADELLELNDFPSDEERSIFLANVYKEADGKELKIACSQSCSRLMERLILLSNVEQKKKLFGKFAENFPHLIQHRFASHCCEMLFIQSAPTVTQELTADSKKKKNDKQEQEQADGEAEASMESLFLQTLDEIEGQMTFLLTDRFASHALRVLLVILSGRPLEQSSTKTMLQSKRKEKTSVTGLEITPTELTLKTRSVPSSFQYAVEKIISDTIATMDTSFVRILATHATGNPTLQLLLELELTNPNSKKGTNSDEKTIITSLLPDDIESEDSESAVFINGLLYDPIGSRLLETICTFAPGKLFKQIYKSVFKNRIAAVCRNEISSYVAIRILSRISKEDLEEAVAEITPQIPGLVERNRTVIIKTLLERCHVRGADTEALVASISAAYGDQPENLLLKMACIDDITSFIAVTQPVESSEDAEEAEKAAPQQAKPTAPQLHGSLLAQTMLSIPGPTSELIQKSILNLPPQILLSMAMYTTTTHIIQSALLPSVSNTVPFRRKIINSLLFPPSTDSEREQSPVLRLSLSSTGSRVLDVLLISTAASPALDPTRSSSSSSPLFQLAERIARILTTHEHTLRDSFFGRIVWRNWSLDMFNHRRGDWVKKVKATPSPVVAVPAPVIEEDGNETKKKDRKSKKRSGNSENARFKGNPNGKSGIELAREKFAAAKLVGGGSGSNRLPLPGR